MSLRARSGAAALAAGLAGLPIAAASAAAAGPVSATLQTAAAPRAQLAPAASLELPGGAGILRYRQRAGGLPVFDSEAIVVVAGARSTLVADDTAASIRPVGSANAISRSAAIAAGRRIAAVRRLRAGARARFGIDPGSGRLAWQVSLPAAAPLGDFLVTLDARSAQRLALRDLLHRADATAAIFDPSPVVTQGSYDGLRDNKDRNSARLTGLRQAVTLPRLRGARGCLRGVYVEAKLGRKARRVCSRGRDFTDLTRSRSRFEAVMSYFHVDRTRAYVDGLGLTERLRAKPQHVRANAIKQDNSFFSSMTRTLTLGSGGVDDGEDADVIVHEYGHSLQDQAVRHFGLSTGAAAIGEGFGDYLAAAMSAERTGGSPFDACIFDWDAVSYSTTGCGRRVDRDLDKRQAQRRCRGEVHCLGEAWSSLLWSLRGTLGDDPVGRSVIDRVVLESNFMLVPRSNFGDGARALLAADRVLYGGVHKPTLEAALIDRRFCKPRGC